METTTIVVLLVAVVIVSIAIIVFSQMRERARIERARKITALEDTYNRANRLISEIPKQYLTPELKLILIRRMEDVCKELTELKAGQSVSSWLEAIQQLKITMGEKHDTGSLIIIDSPEKSTYVKELLENLFKMIEAMHKAGRLDTNTAKKSLKYVLFLIHKTHADLYVFQARDCVKKNEIRKAIHAYHMASTEIGKSRDNPLAMKAVQSFRVRIKELEALAMNGADISNTESTSKLDRDWDNFLHDDEWKKKADYDDD